MRLKDQCIKAERMQQSTDLSSPLTFRQFLLLTLASRSRTVKIPSSFILTERSVTCFSDTARRPTYSSAVTAVWLYSTTGGGSVVCCISVWLAWTRLGLNMVKNQRAWKRTDVTQTNTWATSENIVQPSKWCPWCFSVTLSLAVPELQGDGAFDLVEMDVVSFSVLHHLLHSAVWSTRREEIKVRQFLYFSRKDTKVFVQVVSSPLNQFSKDVLLFTAKLWL